MRKAIGYAIDRDAIVKYLRRGLRVDRRSGIVPPMSWAFERDVFDFRYDPAEARRLLDEAGYPDPDGDGPRPRFTLTLKTSTARSTACRPRRSSRIWPRVGIARRRPVVGVRDAARPTSCKGNFQLYTLQWVGVTDPDMLRRVFHSTQVPPAGLNRGTIRTPTSIG